MKQKKYAVSVTIVVTARDREDAIEEFVEVMRFCNREDSRIKVDEINRGKASKHVGMPQT